MEAIEAFEAVVCVTVSANGGSAMATGKVLNGSLEFLRHRATLYQFSRGMPRSGPPIVAMSERFLVSDLLERGWPRSSLRAPVYEPQMPSLERP